MFLNWILSILISPYKKHNLIQTISRVNRKLEGKSKGLVVDYIGIKSQMNQALAMYSRIDATNFEDIQQSVTEVKKPSRFVGGKSFTTLTVGIILVVSHKRNYPASTARRNSFCVPRKLNVVLWDWLNA